eukprot:RCo024187
MPRVFQRWFRIFPVVLLSVLPALFIILGRPDESRGDGSKHLRTKIITSPEFHFTGAPPGPVSPAWRTALGFHEDKGLWNPAESSVINASPTDPLERRVVVVAVGQLLSFNSSAMAAVHNLVWRLGQLPHRLRLQLCFFGTAAALVQC